MRASGHVYLELPAMQLGTGEVVLAAALRLLPPDITLQLGLAGVRHEPTPIQIQYVQTLCRALAPELSRNLLVTPDRLLLAEPGAQDSECIASLVAAAEPAAAMQAVLVIAAVAQSIDVTHLGSAQGLREIRQPDLSP